MTTAQPTLAPSRSARIVAASLAALLAVTLAACGAADPADPSPTVESPRATPTPEPTADPGETVDPPTPTVTVSHVTGLDGAGDTVIVTGEGFVPFEPDTTATRRPLSGKFGGVYVTFGRNADVWQPSQGADAGTRTALELYWMVFEEDVETIGGADAGGVAINPDGSFEIEVSVTDEHRNDPGQGNYGIYTYAGGGAEFAPFETFTALEFD